MLADPKKIQGLLEAVTPKIENLSPIVKSETLDNGSEIVTVSSPQELTSFSVVLILKLGSTIESDSQHGLLHFLEHVVPACFSVNGGTLDDFCETNRWGLEVSTSPGSLRFGFSVPDFGDRQTDQDFGPTRALTELFKMIASPDWKTERLEIERNRVLDEIAKDKDSFVSVMYQYVKSQRYLNLAYSHSVLGSFEEVAGYSMSEIENFFSEVIQPSHMVLLMHGNKETINRMLPSAKESLLGYEASPNFIETPDLVISPDFRGSTHFLETNLSSSPELLFIFPCAEGGMSLPVAKLVSFYLVDKIEKSLSFELGLTYQTDTFLFEPFNDSYWEISIGCLPEKTKAVTEALTKVLGDLCEKGLSQDELEKLKQSYHISNLKGLETVNWGKIVDYKISSREDNLDLKPSENSKAVELVDVREFLCYVRQCFDPTLSTSFMFGPKEVLDQNTDWQGLRVS